MMCIITRWFVYILFSYMKKKPPLFIWFIWKQKRFSYLYFSTGSKIIFDMLLVTNHSKHTAHHNKPFVEQHLQNTTCNTPLETQPPITRHSQHTTHNTPRSWCGIVRGIEGQQTCECTPLSCHHRRAQSRWKCSRADGTSAPVESQNSASKYSLEWPQKWSHSTSQQESFYTQYYA